MTISRTSPPAFDVRASLMRRLLRRLFGRRLPIIQAVIDDSAADVQDQLAVFRLEARNHANALKATLLFAVIGAMAAWFACLSITAMVIILAWDQPYRNEVAIGVAVFWSLLTIVMMVKARQISRMLANPFRATRMIIDDDLGLLRQILDPGTSRS